MKERSKALKASVITKCSKPVQMSGCASATVFDSQTKRNSGFNSPMSVTKLWAPMSNIPIPGPAP